MASSLNAKNYLNAVGYLLNTIGTFATGFIGSGNLPDQGEISAKYQTLVTPVGWAFSIWGIIFLSQLVFVVAQFLPRYRAHELVQVGVGYFYFAVCVAQFFWSPIFAREKIALSSVVMAFILAPLVVITYQTSKIYHKNLTEYWILKFPFHVHCGWIIVAFAVNINATAVASESSASTQFGLAIASLVYVVAASVYALLLDNPNLAIPLVSAWATLGIAIELNAPNDLILSTFSDGRINTVRIASACVCLVLVLTTLVCGVKKRGGYRSDSSESP